MKKISEKARRAFEKFHARPVDKVTSVVFTMPKALTFLAKAHSIEYFSDKRNGPAGGKKTHRYRHKFGSDVKIYLHPNGRWLLISGGKFRVTDWLRG